MTGDILGAVAWLALAYMVVVAALQSTVIAAAALALRTHLLTTVVDRRRWVLGSPLAPRISVLAPAHNQEATVVDRLTALLALGYPRLEVVFVSDGSGDRTMEVVKRAFSLEPVHTVHRHAVPSTPLRAIYRSRDHPELLVVDKEHGGKADSLNAGLNCATGELVCIIDAATIVQPDALLLMVVPFMRRDDTVAVGGTVGVSNGCEISQGRITGVGTPRSFLAGVQVVEYLRAYLFGRLGWNLLGGNLVISAAFGLFRRDAVIGIGGYETGSLAEDMEVVVALRRRARRTGTASRVEFVPDPVAATEVPETLRGLGRQRDRWQRGLAGVILRHAGMIGNPRDGRLGLVVSPYFLFVELVGPVVEAVGITAIALGLLSGAVEAQLALFFLLAVYGWGALLNLAAVLLEQAGFDRYRGRGDRAWLVLWAFAEAVLFRPLTVAWRLRGMWRFAAGANARGRSRRRIGLRRTPAPTQAAPAQPAPTQPAPTQPAPTQPARSRPAA